MLIHARAPCIFASKDEIAALPESRVQQIAGVERELTDDAIARGVERPGRSFFHMRGDPVTGASGFAPIERVREWARTDRGGAQFKMLETAEPGCMRWGLCETAGRRGEAEAERAPSPAPVENAGSPAT